MAVYFWSVTYFGVFNFCNSYLGAKIGQNKNHDQNFPIYGNDVLSTSRLSGIRPHNSSSFFNKSSDRNDIYIFLLTKDFENTVKPVLRDHFWNNEQWSFKKDNLLKEVQIYMKFSMTTQEKGDLLIQMTA